MSEIIPAVKPGQRVAARHINRIADVAARGVSGPGLVRSQRPGEQLINIRDPLGRAETAITVWGVLDSGATAVEAYQVLAIGSDASQWGNAASEMRAVWIEDFDSENLDRLAVALEPIEPGRAGRVAIAGTAYAKTDGSEVGAYGQPESGARVLTTALSGPSQILSHDTAEQIAFIRFPIGGPGESGSQWQFVWNEGADL